MKDIVSKAGKTYQIKPYPPEKHMYKSIVSIKALLSIDSQKDNSSRRTFHFESRIIVPKAKISILSERKINIENFSTCTIENR